MNQFEDKVLKDFKKNLVSKEQSAANKRACKITKQTFVYLWLIMHTLTKSEESDEMPHRAAFHQGLHCLPRQKQSSEREIQSYLKMMACDCSIYILDHFKFIWLLYQTRMKNPIVHKGLTLKALITTAADNKFCNISPIFHKNMVWCYMTIVCQQTILMKYHALLVIFEKAAKIEIVVCCDL